MPSVLFICTANICRSPMAEVLFRQLAQENDPQENWVVASAGTYTRGGERASKFSGEVMRSRGLRLDAHLSQGVSLALLDSFDLILTMTGSHKESLRIEFPKQASKIYLLSEMIGEDFDIADPIGSPLDEYEATAKSIDSIVREGFPRIQSLAKQASATR